MVLFFLAEPPCIGHYSKYPRVCSSTLRRKDWIPPFVCSWLSLVTCRRIACSLCARAPQLNVCSHYFLYFWYFTKVEKWASTRNEDDGYSDQLQMQYRPHKVAFAKYKWWWQVTISPLSDRKEKKILISSQTLKHFSLCTLEFPSAYCGELKTVFGV